MATVDDGLDSTRQTLDRLITQMEGCESVWTTPTAPGKWSPSQLVEHVARSFEESAHVVAGEPTKLPTLPSFLRPLVRIFFHRILKKGTFPKAKTNAAMNPESGPASPTEAKERLESAYASFDRVVRETAARSGDMTSGAFGRVSIADYVRFTDLHTEHHRLQLP